MSRLRTVLSFVFAITILSQCSPLWAENAVPVVMWGDSATENSETMAVNPFVKITRNEFNEILNSTFIGKPPILAVLVDNLCVEDIRRYQKQVQNALPEAKYTYMPLVEEASSAFQELPMYNQTDDVDVETISDGQILIKPIANLDSFSDVVSGIMSPGMVVVLTGKTCIYRKPDRVKRETAADSKESTEFIVGTDRALFYASRPMQLKVGDTKSKSLTPIKLSHDNGGTPGSPLTLRMQFDGDKSKIDLDFTFDVKTAGYFTLSSVKYQENLETHILKSSSNIVFPFKFSYHCSQMTAFKNDTVELTIADFQVEIDGVANTFNDAYDCVGFTTIPIWTGLFVTAILAAIMIWGLSMIIDIRTMDRFDDPKGKTITISAQE